MSEVESPPVTVACASCEGKGYVYKYDWGLELGNSRFKEDCFLCDGTGKIELTKLQIELPNHGCECAQCSYNGCEHNPEDEEEKRECEEEKEEYGRCQSRCEYCDGEGIIDWSWQVDDTSDCDFCPKENVDIQIFHDAPPGKRCVCKQCYIACHASHAETNGCKEWKGAVDVESK